MSLDPQIAALIDQARLAGGPRTEELALGDARSNYTTRYRARSMPPDRDVPIQYLTIPGPGGGIRARIYRPPGKNGSALPLAVYFHGGGFVLGDADAYEFQSMVLAARSGCAILFPEFRLAPEHPFPAAIDDAIAVVDWVAANASFLKIDPARIAVMGDSAGGNLATNVCIAARDCGGPPIRLQCLAYPAIDYRYLAGGPGYPSLEMFGQGYWLELSTRQWFFHQYFSQPEDAHDPRASPILAEDLSGLPRAVVLTAEFDPLRDIGRAFFDRLVAAGTPAEYRCVPGMVHNFLGHSGVSAAAERALLDVADLLRQGVHD